jgi:hypothetical protein
MKNPLCSFLALPLMLLSPAFALADTISTFDVSGTAENVSTESLGLCSAGATCDFSGTFQVDVATGAVDSLDITFPGLPTIDSPLASAPSPPSFWQILADNSSSDHMTLIFTTPTPDSLEGFTGGTIEIGVVNGLTTMDFLYVIGGGTITPVPEPSSLVPVAGGLGWLVFRLMRRRRARMR